MGLCPLVVFDRIATRASNGGSEFVDVLLGDSFPLDSCSLEWQRKDWDRIHSDFWSVHCPLTVCHPPGVLQSHNSISGFCVQSTPRFQSLDFTSSENTICIPNETFCVVVSHSKPNPILVPGIHSVHWICSDLLCQHLLTKRNELLCGLVAVQSFKWRLPVTTLMTSGQDASCMLHQPRQDK